MRRITVIAVAVVVIMAVILLTGGVVAESDVPDTLAFFGVTVRTTSAQIFLTGALCTWALLAAAWLLAAGIRRSRERGAELALLRSRTGSRVDDTGSAEPTRRTDQGELAGLLGFAVRPGGIVADRFGSGSGGDHADTGQDPAEQPPRRQ
jgi:hypothetical protein